MRYLVALLLLLTAPCHAQDWTATDTAYEAAYLALHTADWAQSRYGAAHPDRYEERNPILGKHPTDSEVNRYFLLSGAVHIGLAYVLPDKWRRGFQLITIGIEAGVVAQNYRLGVRFKF